MTIIEQNLEVERANHVKFIGEDHKKAFGQYFTPIKIARFMASLFPKSNTAHIKILDPGAGIGILACSLIERIKTEQWSPEYLKVDAYDIDINVTKSLQTNLEAAIKDLSADLFVSNENFLERACQPALFANHERYSHVIMNPPYSKINAKSKERLLLRSIGVETVNLYSGFLAAAIHVTEQQGHIVAIIPRSFCNGAYFEPFRRYLFTHCAIKQIHLFESRKDAFKAESVLQENVIIHLQKGASQEQVLVTYSTRSDFSEIRSQYYPFKEIVDPSGTVNIISIPVPGTQIEGPVLTSSLPKLGISVSTGPIVDFRMRELLEEKFIEDSYPLLYPTHQKKFVLDWPKDGKKPNAIKDDPIVTKQLFPAGNYVIVKRFSSKEETRRIVASIITENSFPTRFFTAENHLNIFHSNKHGINKEIAYGLFVYLNTTYADEQFRLFSGHTQVNATDLKNFPYPSSEILQVMGRAAIPLKTYDQFIFDIIFNKAVKTNGSY